MTTLTITIPIDAEWPTSKQLAARNKVEAALGASGIMHSSGAGGGLGEMDLSFRVDDDSRVPAARAKIEAAMALIMPGFEYEVAVQKEPVRTFQVKVGDIFAIPLAERQYAVGICTFVFQGYKGLTACRIFDGLVAEPKHLGDLPSTTAFDPLFVWDHSIADGAWPIIGHAEVETRPLMYCNAGGIYNGEEYLRPDDYKTDLPKMYLAGPVAAENQLRERFGLTAPAEGPGRTSG
jgi:Immunity protein 26